MTRDKNVGAACYQTLLIALLSCCFTLSCDVPPAPWQKQHRLSLDLAGFPPVADKALAHFRYGITYKRQYTSHSSNMTAKYIVLFGRR